LTKSGLKRLTVTLLIGALTGCSALSIVDGLTPESGYRLKSAIAYGHLPRQKADVYMPDSGSPPYPTVVFFYGGRWTFGDRDDYRFVGQALASRGILTIIADYRQYPEVRFPAFVEDGARAVAWAHGNVTQYGGDPGMLFLMGHSSGAHIAAMLATDCRYLRDVGGDQSWLSGFIGLAGPYDFLPLTDDGLIEIFGPEDLQPASQPINFVDFKTPPMLLMHGLKDNTVWVRNARNLASRALEHDVPVTTIYYPDIGHMRIIGAVAEPFQGWAPVAEDITEFVHAMGEPDRMNARHQCCEECCRTNQCATGTTTQRENSGHERAG